MTHFAETSLANGQAPPTERCYWVVPDKLLAGSYPGHPDSALQLQRLEAMYAAGVRTFLNLMEADETDKDQNPFNPYLPMIRQWGEPIEMVRMSIVDMNIPTTQQMTAILDTLDQFLLRPDVTYVHCFGGMGRTGTVIGCWLMRHGLANSKNVLEIIAQLRQVDTQRRSVVVPQTPTQRQFVLDWQPAS